MWEMLQRELVVLLFYNLSVPSCVLALLKAEALCFEKFKHIHISTPPRRFHFHSAVTPLLSEISPHPRVKSGTAIFLGNGGINISRKLGIMRSGPQLLKGNQEHFVVTSSTTTGSSGHRQRTNLKFNSVFSG